MYIVNMIVCIFLPLGHVLALICYLAYLMMVTYVCIFFRPEGYAKFQETVPDTITSWVATAFAVHPNTGLGLSPGPVTVSYNLYR